MARDSIGLSSPLILARWRCLLDWNRFDDALLLLLLLWEVVSQRCGIRGDSLGTNSNLETVKARQAVILVGFPKVTPVGPDSPQLAS